MALGFSVLSFESEIFTWPYIAPGNTAENPHRIQKIITLTGCNPHDVNFIIPLILKIPKNQRANILFL